MLRSTDMPRSRLVCLALAAAFSGCGSGGAGGDDSASDGGADVIGRCASLDGRAFSSVEVQPDCGLGPDGPVPCNWSVVFDASTSVYTGWQYHHSDVVESGDIGCQGGGAIVLVTGNHTATYDAGADRLVWDDIVYAPE